MNALTKREVRHAARARRRELAATMDRRAAGETIARTVLSLLTGPSRVAAYESVPDEPPTGRLVEALLAAGHEVIVPVVLDDFSLQWRYAAAGTVGDRATVTRRSAPPTETEQAAWLGTDALAGCDLVITPGLSVDGHGTRLGQGGGCYDRALAHRRAGALVITLLHEGEQSAADLPRDDHDRPVDAYLTTSGRLVRVG
jgi:5-formyltetrahydrofolate cyclo-ligase